MDAIILQMYELDCRYRENAGRLPKNEERERNLYNIILTVYLKFHKTEV